MNKFLFFLPVALALLLAMACGSADHGGGLDGLRTEISGSLPRYAEARIEGRHASMESPVGYARVLSTGDRFEMELHADGSYTVKVPTGEDVLLEIKVKGQIVLSRLLARHQLLYNTLEADIDGASHLVAQKAMVKIKAGMQVKDAVMSANKLLFGKEDLRNDKRVKLEEFQYVGAKLLALTAYQAFRVGDFDTLNLVSMFFLINEPNEYQALLKENYSSVGILPEVYRHVEKVVFQNPSYGITQSDYLFAIPESSFIQVEAVVESAGGRPFQATVRVPGGPFYELSIEGNMIRHKSLLGRYMYYQVSFEGQELLSRLTPPIKVPSQYRVNGVTTLEARACLLENPDDPEQTLSNVHQEFFDKNTIAEKHYEPERFISRKASEVSAAYQRMMNDTGVSLAVLKQFRDTFYGNVSFDALYADYLQLASDDTAVFSAREAVRTIKISTLSSELTGLFDTNARSKSCYIATDHLIFSVSNPSNKLDVLQLSTQMQPEWLKTIDLSQYGNSITGLAANEGLVAVAIQRTSQTVHVDGALVSANSRNEAQEKGILLLLSTEGGVLKSMEVGEGPSDCVFSDDGTMLAIACTGQPLIVNGVWKTDVYDPEGMVCLIDLSRGIEASELKTINFSDLDNQSVSIRNDGVRLTPGSNPSTDLQPSALSFSKDGSKLWVAFESNNALARIDLNKLGTDFVKGAYPSRSEFGMPVLKQYMFTNLPSLGNNLRGDVFALGGFSGLAFKEVAPSGNLVFATIPDTGPRAEYSADTSYRIHWMYNYQARKVEFELNENTGEIIVTTQTLLKRTRVTNQGTFIDPVTGLPNTLENGFDETPADSMGKLRSFDLYGGDMEGIALHQTGFVLCDEYRPSVYFFNEEGMLLERAIPSTDLLSGSLGNKRLPANYAFRERDNGFEGLAYRPFGTPLFFAVMSTALQPGLNQGNEGIRFVRMAGLSDTPRSPVVEEYLYAFDGRKYGRVGELQISAATHDLQEYAMYFIEQDYSTTTHAGFQQIVRVDYSGATNIKDMDGVDGKAFEELDLQTLGQTIVLPKRTPVVDLNQLGYGPAMDIEGLCMLPDGRFAVINDNNYAQGPEEKEIYLGIISFTTPTGLDASRSDGYIRVVPRPIFLMPMPSKVASYSVESDEYLVTVNSGKNHGEGITAGSAKLDSKMGLLSLNQSNDKLGEIVVSPTDGDMNHDGKLDGFYAYGSRSISVYDQYGNRMWDSAAILETEMAERYPEGFNVSARSNQPEAASVEHGPKPSGLALGRVAGNTYAFVTLENFGGVAVFDVTDPKNVRFLQMLNPRDFQLDPRLGTEQKAIGDLGPMDIDFIPAWDNPSGLPLLIVSNAVSGSTRIYEISH